MPEMIRSTAIALMLTLAAHAGHAAPRVVTIAPGPAYTSKAINLDGTQPYTVTPTPDGKTTVSQGSQSATFLQQAFMAKTSGTWPTCPSKPPIATRIVQCPNGYNGTWTQTQDWQSAAYPACWTPQPWAPTSAPPGACTPVAPPPPSGLVVDYSYVNQASQEFARFKTFVDTAVAHPNDSQTPYLFGAMDAAAMYRITGGEQYRSLAIATADRQVTAANAKITAGQNPDVAGDSYLGVGGMIGDVAAALAWCNPTDAQRAAWVTYMRQAVFNVWNPSLAKWGTRAAPWTGWAVNDPANNYYYSFIRATMFFALATGDATAVKDGKPPLEYLRTDRLPLLTSFYATIPSGGSLEGTGYGLSHMGLFELYQVWKDSGQGDIANASTHMTRSAEFWTHATTPDLARYAPFGDQSRVSEPLTYDYNRRNVIEARNLSNDAGDVAVADWYLRHIPIQQVSGFGTRYNMFTVGAGTTAPAALNYRAPEVGAVFARASWSDPQAPWFAGLFGTYSQSHAHPEQGSFTLYWRGAWQTVTNNIWSHSGIHQTALDNNVVRFERGGSVLPQHQGHSANVTAYTVGQGGAFHLAADLSSFYDAGVQWVRTVDFAANGKTTVADALTLGAGVSAIWQANLPTRPTVSGNVVTTAGMVLTVLEPANPQITIVDMHAQDADYNTGFRVDVAGGSAYRVTMEPR